jgi:hypothetical protein
MQDKRPPQWEELAPGVCALRLYRTELNPDWPRIVILDLTADKFREFDEDPLGFDNRYDLYPEQPVLWASTCQKPPEGKGIPSVREHSAWRVVLTHTHTSTMSSAAAPIET